MKPLVKLVEKAVKWLTPEREEDRESRNLWNLFEKATTGVDMNGHGNVMEPMRVKLKDFCGVGRTGFEGDRVIEALEQIIDTSLSEARKKEKALKDKQKLVAEEQHKANNVNFCDFVNVSDVAMAMGFKGAMRNPTEEGCRLVQQLQDVLQAVKDRKSGVDASDLARAMAVYSGQEDGDDSDPTEGIQAILTIVADIFGDREGGSIKEMLGFLKVTVTRQTRYGCGCCSPWSRTADETGIFVPAHKLKTLRDGIERMNDEEIETELECAKTGVKDTGSTGATITGTSSFLVICLERHKKRGKRVIMTHNKVKFEADSLYKIAGQFYLVVAVQRWYKTCGGHFTTLVRSSAAPGSEWLEYNDHVVKAVESEGVQSEGLVHCLLLRRMRGSCIDAFKAEAKAVQARLAAELRSPRKARST